jgi:DNA polymerase-3 subunit gamma/tau
MPLQNNYRINNINDLYGNYEVKESLKSVLLRKTDTPHSFLFTGDSGTGKTSLARILKKEFGCSEHSYIELNASDERGIESIRDIIKKSSYITMDGSPKMYVFDECHMLTTDSQEALLKVVEEPPSYLFFVFCTTEPEKLKPTLRRRCHNYKLTKLTYPDIKQLIENVLHKENVFDFDEKIINKICEISDGSPGIALKILDQIIDVTIIEDVHKFLNTYDVSEEDIKPIIDILLNGGEWKDIAKVLKNNEQPIEAVRTRIYNYFGVVLLNTVGTKADKCARIMSFLNERMFQKHDLTLALYFCHKGDSNG